MPKFKSPLRVSLLAAVAGLAILAVCSRASAAEPTALASASFGTCVINL